ncbi:MAG: ribonuclease HI family protein [Promethearchaeota archaeon]
MITIDRNINKDKKAILNNEIDELHIFTDGASRGNPGKAAMAFIFLDPKNEKKAPLFVYSKYLGIKTNNQAEYEAILAVLKKAAEFSPINPKNIVVFSDSELVIRQLNGIYRVKNHKLREYFNEIQKLVAEFNNIQFKHVPRTNRWISFVDKLCNKELDKS